MLLTNINSWENLGFHCKIHCKINLKKILTPVKLEYFEYQSIYTDTLYEEFGTRINQRLYSIIIQRIKSKFTHLFSNHQKSNTELTIKYPTEEKKLMGNITWNKIPLEEAKAIHESHIEGVLCGVWRKQ